MGLPKSKFPLGRIVVTKGVSEFSGRNPDFAPFSAICLHSKFGQGDWGNVCDDDKEANNEALKDGGMVLGSYKFNGTEIWIITDSDRKTTTILLPEEY